MDVDDDDEDDGIGVQEMTENIVGKKTFDGYKLSKADRHIKTPVSGDTSSVLI